MTKKAILVRAHDDENYITFYDRLTKQDREWDQEVIRIPAPLWKAYEQAQATVRDLEAHFADLPKEAIKGRWTEEAEAND
jgi:hypothetical protein